MADRHAPGSAGPRWIGLAGPTAAGKTAAALALAQRWPVEIISVDSALVYRGMDIGTAKPTAAERRAVVHHLIDIIDPAQAYSAAGFVRDARRLIDDVQARGRTPLLVGGTMMYFKALIHGLDELPPADPTVRAQIDLEAQRLGWPALHAQLQTHDPATARRLAPTDAQRIQRALEVYRLTGRPLSSYHHRADRGLSVPAHVISLEPARRAWLHQRIEQRFSQMLKQGLVQEVIALRARADLHEGLPSMRCVGYRQVWETLAGVEPEGSLLARGVAATRQLAKRQLTWLRAMPGRLTVPCDADDALAEVIDACAQLLPPAR